MLKVSRLVGIRTKHKMYGRYSRMYLDLSIEQGGCTRRSPAQRADSFVIALDPPFGRGFFMEQITAPSWFHDNGAFSVSNGCLKNWSVQRLYNRLLEELRSIVLRLISRRS